MRRPSASVKAAMSAPLPKACSEICARELPFMPRQGIGGDLLDLDHARAATSDSPKAARNRRASDPAPRRSACQRRGRRHGDRANAIDGLPCAGPSRGSGETSCGRLRQTRGHMKGRRIAVVLGIGIDTGQRRAIARRFIGAMSAEGAPSGGQFDLAFLRPPSRARSAKSARSSLRHSRCCRRRFPDKRVSDRTIPAPRACGRDTGQRGWSTAIRREAATRRQKQSCCCFRQVPRLSAEFGAANARA